VSKLLRIKLYDARRIAGILWRENIARRRETTGQDGVYHTFNEWHLGDNLIHLNFLRRLALRHPDFQFIHACRAGYHGQLKPLILPLPNVTLVPLEARAPHAVNAWKNHGAFTSRGGCWAGSPLKLDWVAFHLDFFAKLAARMGLESPAGTAADLMFDYPALQTDSQLPGRWDVLVCNSQMLSSQVPGWRDGDWDDVIELLIKKGKTVVCTQPSRTGTTCTWDHRLSVTGVGNVSLRANMIIGCPCGPMWPTFNVWSREKPRICVLAKETVALGANTRHARNKAELAATVKALV
jgi:hypothetical protein